VLTAKPRCYVLSFRVEKFGGWITAKRKDSYLRHVVQTGSGAQFPIQFALWSYSEVLKRSEHEGDHISSSAEVKNAEFTSTSPIRLHSAVRRHRVK
jgi:hypothetical protein